MVKTGPVLKIKWIKTVIKYIFFNHFGTNDIYILVDGSHLVRTIFLTIFNPNIYLYIKFI